MPAPTRLATDLSGRTGRLLYAMGNIKSSQGLLEESLSFHERAYRQFTATVGPNHHRTCDVSCRMAIHYARLGRNDESMYVISVYSGSATVEDR